MGDLSPDTDGNKEIVIYPVGFAHLMCTIQRCTDVFIQICISSIHVTKIEMVDVTSWSLLLGRRRCQCR